MTRISRNITFDQARDLLERGARACLAFASDHGAQAQPVLVIWHDARFFVGMPQAAAQKPAPASEVVLLVDEGIHFFDLRALYVRGHAHPVEPPPSAPSGHTWFELIPLKTVAWDYGTLHEESSDEA